MKYEYDSIVQRWRFKIVLLRGLTVFQLGALGVLALGTLNILN